MHSCTNGTVLSRFTQTTPVQLMRAFRVGSTGYFVIVSRHSVSVVVDAAWP